MTHAELIKSRAADIAPSPCAGSVCWQRRQIFADGRPRDVWRCSECGDVLFSDSALCVVGVVPHARKVVSK